MKEAGRLFLVATPIGNLEDITIRALKILRHADSIAAEDTRTARRLLERYRIHTPLESYYDSSEEYRSRQLVKKLKKGNDIALISEAGQPGISDPGFRLVSEAIENGIRVIPIPGPTALITALVASGLAVDRFVFEGFLPSKKILRRKCIYRLQEEERTVVFYVSPRRIIEVLSELRRILGNRRVAIGRELTKKFEEFIRGDLDEIIEKLKKRRVRGEIVLIMEGNRGDNHDDQAPLAVQIENARNLLGISKMEAIKLVASRRGRPKSEIYRLFHQGRGRSDPKAP